MNIESILTPETDAQIISVTVDPDGDCKDMQCVPADFARQLERESTHLRERCKSYAEREDSIRYLQTRCRELETAGANLVDLIRSARAIAQRKGEGTAWGRFDAALAKTGIGSVTPKTFRILGDDDPELLSQRTADEKPDGQAENNQDQERR